MVGLDLSYSRQTHILTHTHFSGLIQLETVPIPFAQEKIMSFLNYLLQYILHG
jgi:hypothetical protein